MTVQRAWQLMQGADPTARLFVRDAAGAWTLVEAIQLATLDAIYAPTSILLEGTRYVRADVARPEGDA